RLELRSWHGYRPTCRCRLREVDRNRENRLPRTRRIHPDAQPRYLLNMSDDRAHVLLHASELLTGEGIRRKDGRRIQEEELGRIVDGAMAYSTKTVPYVDFATGKKGMKVVADRILWVGKSDELPSEYANSPIFDLDGKNAVTPGFVDCHTHLVFAGDRATDFA